MLMLSLRTFHHHIRKCNTIYLPTSLSSSNINTDYVLSNNLKKETEVQQAVWSLTSVLIELKACLRFHREDLSSFKNEHK